MLDINTWFIFSSNFKKNSIWLLLLSLKKQNIITLKFKFWSLKMFDSQHNRRYIFENRTHLFGCSNSSVSPSRYSWVIPIFSNILVMTEIFNWISLNYFLLLVIIEFFWFFDSSFPSFFVALIKAKQLKILFIIGIWVNKTTRSVSFILGITKICRKKENPSIKLNNTNN